MDDRNNIKSMTLIKMNVIILRFYTAITKVSLLEILLQAASSVYVPLKCYENEKGGVSLLILERGLEKHEQ